MKRWSVLKAIVSVFCMVALLVFPESASFAAGMSVNAEEVSLYALDDGYSGQISIPSEYAQNFKIQVSGAGETPYFFVAEGDSVEVSADGLVTPATTVWYWNGNIGSSVSSGAEGERVVVEHNFGKSVVGIRSGSETRYITVTVHNYAVVYADEVMENYIKENITDSMTDLEKLEKITAFPAQYDYDGRYSGYVSMIIWKGGDCWASSNAILKLCEMTGLKAHLRYGANEPGAGSGHRNVAVQIGDSVYVAEAGYSEKAPRYYSVTKENTGFYYSVRQGKATIIQYDGFKDTIKVPAEINGFPVTAIGELAFNYGERYSGVAPKKIELPNTLEKIGESAFNSCKKLKEITIPASVKEVGDLAFTACSALENIFVEEGNTAYTDIDGVLFSGDKTSLLAYPAGKIGNYTIPAGVGEIAGYAFYYTEGVKKVVVPESVAKIGEGAFGDSKVNWLCFVGDMPEIDAYAFYGLSLSLYYPEENGTWNRGKEAEYMARSIDWKSYTDLEAVLKQTKSLLGDADGDGEITPDDALAILMQIAGKGAVKREDLADVNKKNGIDADDALAVLMHVAGKKPITE